MVPGNSAREQAAVFDMNVVEGPDLASEIMNTETTLKKPNCMRSTYSFKIKVHRTVYNRGLNKH